MSDIVAKNIRFTKDYNLPINIFNEKMFPYYRELYKEFWPVHEEYLMENEIKESGSIDKWLEKYATLRDSIINSIELSDKYKEFISCDMKRYDVEPDLYNNIGERSYYTNETDGKRFISIDLKKANFQALKYARVLDDNSYKDFIEKYGGSEYFYKSKYLRQVIFGKLNPKRTVKVEKFIMSLIYKFLIFEYSGAIKADNLYSVNSDELVFRMDEYFDYKWCEIISKTIKEFLGFEVSIEPVEIHKLWIVNSNGNNIDAFVRKNLLTGEEVLKKASTTFYPQIYKIWKGMEITEMDRMFFFEDQIATFNNELMKVK